MFSPLYTLCLVTPIHPYPNIIEGMDFLEKELKIAKNVGKRGKDKKKRDRSGYWLRWQKEKKRTTKKTTP